MTKVKTDEEIINIRESGRMTAHVLEIIGKAVKPGITTKELANLAREELAKLGEGKPAFLGFNGFSDVLCVSVNDAVVHGIPGDEVLQPGDIVSFDFGVNYKGMITDAARSVIVGEASSAEQNLVRETSRALDAGISAVHEGCHVGDIAAAVQDVLDKAKLGIVRDLVGHGVGHELHEEPNIPNYGSAGSGPVLKAGMTIAIEPMATLGTWQVYVDRDRWTVRTYDGSQAAHFEDTVLITNDGCEILTR